MSKSQASAEYEKILKKIDFLSTASSAVLDVMVNQKDFDYLVSELERLTQRKEALEKQHPELTHINPLSSLDSSESQIIR